MRRRRIPIRRARGISLVELMVGLTLSLFILGALAQAFSVASSARRDQEAIARLMDGGRTAAEIVGRAVRMASYWGCTGTTQKDISIHADVSASSLDATGVSTRGIYGIEGANDTETQLITWQAQDNVTATLGSAGATLAPNCPEGSPCTPPPPITVTVTSGTFAAGDWVALGNCQRGDVFRLDSASSSQLAFAGSCNTCANSYAPGAVVQRIQRDRFYIGASTRNPARPSLWVERDGRQQELVEGVEEMRIRYGYDGNRDGLVDVLPSGELDYRPASSTAGLSINGQCATDGSVTCWSNVVSVRINFLLATVEDNVASQTQKYFFDEAERSTTTDKRLRREFVTVIAVRNART